MFYAIHAVRTRYPSKRSQVSTQIPSFMIEAASEAEALKIRSVGPWKWQSTRFSFPAPPYQWFATGSWERMEATYPNWRQYRWSILIQPLSNA